VLSEYPVPVEGFTVQNVWTTGRNAAATSSGSSWAGRSKCSSARHPYIPLCHAKTVLVKEGDKPALGQFLMIADNTGFSTGIRTPTELYRVDIHPMTGGIIKLDTNEGGGSFDPSLFFTNEHAVDVASYATLLSSNLRHYRYR
jgi:hypothetical protein